ncbi:hypothetical protein [Microbacterium sp. NPDC096154]|uniref:hypothetical protein n=1 Tax=Microbacterium sp. NPDC096154 TaxID=3155549 RepID=UPI0033297118
MNSRIRNVVRLQFINTQTYLWVPLLVLGGALLLNIAIFAIIPTGGPKYTGGAQAPMWYFLAVGIQALTLSFPFSQAMSITRREFYLGTLLAAAIAAAMLSTLFVLLGLIELATDGYGIGGYFAHLPDVWQQGWWAAWIVFFVLTMLFFVLGFWFATIYKKGGPLALTVVLLAVGLAGIGALYVIGRLDAWTAVGAWFGSVGVLGLALWGVPLTAVLAVGSYLTLRRLTP